MDASNKSPGISSGTKSNPQLKYTLKRLSDYAEIPSTTFLIERYLPLGAQILLAALPKTLKTYIALSWACCVASGLSWLGHTTKKGRVLFIALESFHGILRRQEAWRIKHDKSKVDLDDLRFATVPVNFAEGGDIQKALDDLAAQNFHPDLVVIDTWFKSTAGADVSDQADMTKALDHLTELQKKLQEERAQDNLPEGTVVIVAHTTKKGMDLFGSIAQLANCDVLYMLNREPGAVEVTLSCTDARDIEEPPDLVIGLEKVTIRTKKGLEQNLAVTRIVDSATRQSAKDERDIETMIDCLQMPPLNNKVTYTQWRERVCDYTSKKVMDKDGKVHVLKQGWSGTTFDTKLALVKKKYGNRLVKFGVGQGATHMLLSSKGAKASEGAQPESHESQEGSTANQPQQTTPAQPPLEEVGLVGVVLDAHPSSPKHPNQGGWGGSRETRTGENRVAENSVLDEALGQLSAETTKH